MRRFLRNNGLSLVLFACFALFLTGQALTGLQVDNAARQAAGEAPLTLTEYLRSGHFVEATFENWESEFLQMGAYVLLTAVLFQRGAADSRDPAAPTAAPTDGPTGPADGAPNAAAAPEDRPPWPARQGGVIRWLYGHSLAIALLTLFVVSFSLHAAGGARAYSDTEVAQGRPAVSVWQFLQTSEFWFQSFQNWQSEFLSVGVLVLLSIVLRQDGSPESKPIDAPHSHTGGG